MPCPPNNSMRQLLCISACWKPEHWGTERIPRLQPNNCWKHSANLGPFDAKLCAPNHSVIQNNKKTAHVSKIHPE